MSLVHSFDDSFFLGASALPTPPSPSVTSPANAAKEPLFTRDSLAATRSDSASSLYGLQPPQLKNTWSMPASAKNFWSEPAAGPHVADNPFAAKTVPPATEHAAAPAAPAAKEPSEHPASKAYSATPAGIMEYFEKDLKNTVARRESAIKNGNIGEARRMKNRMRAHADELQAHIAHGDMPRIRATATLAGFRRSAGTVKAARANAPWTAWLKDVFTRIPVKMRGFFRS